MRVRLMHLACKEIGGAGKSTFIDFCIKYLESKEAKVIHIDPVDFLDSENASLEVKEKVLQELKSIFSDVALLINLENCIKLIGGVKRNFFDFEISWLPKRESVDKYLNDINQRLITNSRNKVVVIVDDLDRVDWNTIKAIVKVSRSLRKLENLVFVFAYSDNQISKLNKKESLSTKLIYDFFEKYIDVKINLFQTADQLLHYFELSSSREISLADPKISPLVDALKEVYKADDFHSLRLYLGDVRKIKRLVNQLVLLKLNEVNYDQSDYDRNSLIKIMLIYMYYPEIFIKICDCELKFYGNFSLKRKEKGWERSDFYNSYSKGLERNAKNLLDSIFNPVRAGSLRDETNPMFNHPESGALRRHLHLILGVEVQNPNESRRAVENLISNFKAGSELKLLLDQEFPLSRGDEQHMAVMTIVRDSVYELDEPIIFQYIDYLSSNSHRYSLFAKASDYFQSSRRICIYDLVITLEKFANFKREPNFNDPQYSRLGKIIFDGVKELKEESLIDRLLGESKNILNFYDLLIFRLNCCINRGQSSHSLAEALLKRQYNNEFIAGQPVNEIVVRQMRELTQKVFSLFNDNFIKTKVNLFDKIEVLTARDLAGEVFDYVTRDLTSDELSVEMELQKDQIRSFIVFQLSSSEIDYGIGCGYYDLTGDSDSKKIRSRFNKYLFDTCFTPPPGSDKNYLQFVRYLMAQFSRSYDGSNTYKYYPSEESIAKMLDLLLLKQYWKKHRSKIIAATKKANDEELTVRTINYMSDRTDLHLLWKVLDNLKP